MGIFHIFFSRAHLRAMPTTVGLERVRRACLAHGAGKIHLLFFYTHIHRETLHVTKHFVFSLLRSIGGNSCLVSRCRYHYTTTIAPKIYSFFFTKVRAYLNVRLFSFNCRSASLKRLLKCPLRKCPVSVFFIWCSRNWPVSFFEYTKIT